MTNYTSAEQGIGTTRQFSTSSGQVDTYSGGTRGGRDFNPGNIMYGAFAQSNGAIGEDNAGFAIFPDYATGRAALIALLNTASVQSRSLNAEIAIYAPPSENNTTAYQQQVATALGVPGTTTISTLTSTQISELADTIQTQEGYQEGTLTSSVTVAPLNGPATTTLNPPAAAPPIAPTPTPAPNLAPNNDLAKFFGAFAQTLISDNSDVSVGTYNEASSDTSDPGGTDYVVYSDNSSNEVVQENEYFLSGNEDIATYDVNNESIDDFYQVPSVGGESLEVLGTDDGSISLNLIVQNGSLNIPFITNYGSIYITPTNTFTINATYLDNDGIIILSNSSNLYLNATLSGDGGYEGQIFLSGDNILNLAGSAGEDQSIIYSGSHSVIVLSQPSEFSGTISGFRLEETIDLAGITANTATADGNGNLQVQEDDGNSISLSVSSLSANQQFYLSPDGSGGTNIITYNDLVVPSGSSPYLSIYDQGPDYVTFSGSGEGLNIFDPWQWQGVVVENISETSELIDEPDDLDNSVQLNGYVDLSDRSVAIFDGGAVYSEYGKGFKTIEETAFQTSLGSQFSTADYEIDTYIEPNGTVYYVYNEPGQSQPEQACYPSGTLIETGRGPAAVENLAKGEMIQTTAGDMRPIIWIGHRRIDCRRHLRPQDVWPIRINAGAFGDGLPTRDLFLSPDHAVFSHGVLIPIKHLINGATIVQEPRDEVTYWHVELDRHDVILAEGLPCESYLDTGNRTAFANAGAAVQLHPDFARSAESAWSQDACAPLVEEGPILAAVCAQLAARAEAIGRPLPRLLEIVLAGTGRTTAALPAEVETIRLVSSSGRVGEDRRRLGGLVTGLWVDGAALGLEDARLGFGFHEVEVHGATRVRWTDGAASIAIGRGERGRLIEIEIAALIAAPVERREVA